MKKYIGLTELRGIACLFVFFSHLSYITRPYIYVGFLGHYGVMIFLMLSGFLGYINHVEENFNTKTYIKRKYKSFFWLYFFLMLVMAIPKFLKHDYIKTILSIIIHISLLQTWLFPYIIGYELNNVDWYLSVIMFCWLFEKPIITLLKKVQYKHTICVIFATIFSVRILLYYIPIANHSMYTQFLYLSPIIRIMDYIMGMISAKYFESNKNNSNKEHIKVPFETITVCLFILSIIAYNYVPIKCSEIVFAGTSSFLLIMVFADNGGGHNKTAQFKVFKNYCQSQPNNLLNTLCNHLLYHSDFFQIKYTYCT